MTRDASGICRSRDERAKRRVGRSGCVVTPVVLVATLSLSAFVPDAKAYEAFTVILETNASPCDTGLQFFWDGDPWASSTITDPDGQPILSVSASNALADFGLTEQFNETNEPVMAELIAGLPPGRDDCEESEGVRSAPQALLSDLFAAFPEGEYQVNGFGVDGDAMYRSATLSHVIPAPPVILGPNSDKPQNRNNTVIRWRKVERLIATSPNVFAPEGITDADVAITGFEVIVEREEVGGLPAPLVVLDLDLAPDITQLRVPRDFLQRKAGYIFEVLQIDASGNQTIAEGEFKTK